MSLSYLSRKYTDRRFPNHFMVEKIIRRHDDEIVLLSFHLYPGLFTHITNINVHGCCVGGRWMITTELLCRSRRCGADGDWTLRGWDQS